MTQPKRTASRLLSALLGLIMLLSLLPTVTLAAERVPEELKAITVTSDIEKIAQFRHPVETPTFKETTGKPVKFKTDPEWWRYNETTGKYERYTEKTFKEGKYKFFIVATITGSDYDQYQFANQVTATVNGTNWKTTGSAIDPGRKLSRILMVSPEYTIEDRQLVNRIVLTSNMEEILAQKEGLDDPSIRVRSAFTTTGTKVSCLDTYADVSAYDWQVKDRDGVFWFKAWDPDDFRPGVQRGAYYRIIFTVKIKYNDRDTYAFVEPDKLTVTLDGAECRIVGDVEGKYGAEMKVLTREYYAPRAGDLQPITSIDLKTNSADLLRANNTIKRPTITETNDKMVFRADSYEDGWQCSYKRVLPNNGGYSFNWKTPETQYFEKGKYYRYGAVLTVKDWEHWKLGEPGNLTITVDGESIPVSYIKRIDDLHVLVYSKEHRVGERTWIREVDATTNAASIVKLGGTVKSPTITFNDGDQALYVDDSKWGDWLRWEGSSWKLYEKSTFEPGQYRYRTYFRVGNWEDYEFPSTAATINNLTVKWDGVECERPVDYTPSQICVTSPAYIVPEVIKEVTATSSDIDSIPKLGGAMTIPTFTVQTGQPARFRGDYPYCAWFKKVDGAWKECGLHVDMDKIFTEGTYRYCVYLFIGGKGHTEDRTNYVFSLDSRAIVNGTMWETWGYKVTDTSSWLRVFSPEYTITAAAPDNVTLTGAKAVSDGIQVTWQAANGAEQYRVYRKDAANPKWKGIATVTGTSWTDKTAQAGVKYTYTVRGISANGTLSPGFDTTGVSATIPAAPTPTTPANVTLGSAKVSGSTIVVTWQAANGAAQYRVYRKDAANPKWKGIANVTGTSWTDKTAQAGVKYTYTVRGISANGTLSPGFDTTGVSATIPAAPTPTTPANVTLGSAKVSGSTIVVTWQAANGAAQYRVYRKDAANPKWKGIANVTGTSWTDKTAQAGVKYTYTVRGISANGTLSPGFDTTGVSATVPGAPTPAPTTPAEVTLIGAVAGSDGITVKWKAAAGAKEYRVYRKGPGETKWKGLVNVTGISWTDRGVKAGAKYTYTVRGIGADGKTLSPTYNNLGVSTTATVTPVPITPANVTLIGATAGSSGIQVTWKTAAGAEKYRVYRIGPGDAKWVGLVNVTGTGWTDTNVTKGVKYTYTVRGISVDGKLSPGFDKTGVSAVAK